MTCPVLYLSRSKRGQLPAAPSGSAQSMGSRRASRRRRVPASQHQRLPDVDEVGLAAAIWVSAHPPPTGGSTTSGGSAPAQQSQRRWSCHRGTHDVVLQGPVIVVPSYVALCSRGNTSHPAARVTTWERSAHRLAGPPAACLRPGPRLDHRPQMVLRIPTEVSAVPPGDYCSLQRGRVWMGYEQSQVDFNTRLT